MIKYEDVNAEWAKDAEDFDANFDAIRHSRETYRLHQKYFDIYSKSVNHKLKLESRLKRLESDKTEYLNGEMSLEDIKKRDWPLQPKRMLKSDVAKAIQYDPDVVKQTLEIGEVQTIIKYTEDIIKIIHQRAYIIKNAIDYEKFITGG